jgi:hypothetical protein
MSAIIVVSERKEDILFGTKLGILAQVPFFGIDNFRKLKLVLKDHPKAAVFWDVDHPDATQISHPLSISNVGQVVGSVCQPGRVFVISSEALNKSPFIFNMPIFNHHLYRQYGDPAAQVTASLAKAAMTGVPFGLDRYVPSGVDPKRIVIKNSGERRKVLEAIERIFTTLTAPANLLTLAIQATDELIMNGVFDAPCRGGVDYYRRKTDRSQDFTLEPKEHVELELAFCKSYFAICVRDQFGSLKRDTVLQFIRKDYEQTEYKVREGDPGAGLGIYGILQSGLSLIFASRANQKTEVILLVPVVKSMKAFRSGFRFFSFM